MIERKKSQRLCEREHENHGRGPDLMITDELCQPARHFLKSHVMPWFPGLQSNGIPRVSLSTSAVTLYGNPLRHIYRPNRGIVIASDSLLSSTLLRLKTMPKSLKNNQKAASALEGSR